VLWLDEVTISHKSSLPTITADCCIFGEEKGGSITSIISICVTATDHTKHSTEMQGEITGSQKTKL